MIIDMQLLRISHMTFTDIVDIIIIAYFAFKVLVWIKETRAWALLKGIVIVLLVSALSNYLNLNTINWIIKNAFSVGILAIIVLFQTEIRKALEQIGKGMLVPYFGSNVFGGNTERNFKMSNSSLKEIGKAVKAMADAKTGAIILIEQDVAVGDHEQTGIPVDGIITKELLINIFEDKTPLHDGAVIIRNNRIAAASCILPLTQKDIAKELGTRHRAGVGASEVTDAYIIIVSEESGSISLAKAGVLKRDLTESQVVDILTEKRSKKRKYKSLFKEGRGEDEKYN